MTPDHLMMHVLLLHHTHLCLTIISRSDLLNRALSTHTLRRMLYICLHPPYTQTQPRHLHKCTHTNAHTHDACTCTHRNIRVPPCTTRNTQMHTDTGTPTHTSHTLFSSDTTQQVVADASLRQFVVCCFLIVQPFGASRATQLPASSACYPRQTDGPHAASTIANHTDDYKPSNKQKARACSRVCVGLLQIYTREC